MSSSSALLASLKNYHTHTHTHTHTDNGHCKHLCIYKNILTNWCRVFLRRAGSINIFETWGGGGKNIFRVGKKLK